MSKVALLPVTCYCLIAYAIHICNSQWSGSFVPQPINLGYASCPLCPRDCPAILSSPWYDPPAIRDARFIKREENGHAARESSIHSNPQRQTRSPLYGKVNPYERYFDSQSRNTLVNSQNVLGAEFEKTNREEESSSNNQVASPYHFTATSSASFKNPRELRGEGGGGEGSYNRQPHPRDQGITYKSGKLQMDSALNGDPIEYGERLKSLLNGYLRQDVNSMIDRKAAVKQDPAREVLVVDFAEAAECDVNPPSTFDRFPPEEFSKRITGTEKYKDDVNTLTETQKIPNVEILPERLDNLEQFYFPKIDPALETLYTPQVKYNPYNLSPNLNVLRMMQNSETQPQEEDKEVLVMSESETTNNKGRDSMNSADMLLQTSQREANEHTEEWMTTNDELIGKMSGRPNDTFQLNPDFVNDMVNPSLVSTEPTTPDPFTETSTTA